VFVVAEGVISEIKEPEAVEEAPAAEVVEEALSREEVVSLIAKAVAEAKKEFSSQIEERDAKITELSKQAAPSLSRAPKMEAPAPVDLKSLSIQERVAAIHNQFSK
jgi:ABC-type sugar transport system ATPase subunit